MIPLIISNVLVCKAECKATHERFITLEKHPVWAVIFMIDVICSIEKENQGNLTPPILRL